MHVAADVLDYLNHIIEHSVLVSSLWEVHLVRLVVVSFDTCKIRHVLNHGNICGGKEITSAERVELSVRYQKITVRDDCLV